MKFFDSESDAVFLSQCWSFPRSILSPKADAPKGKFEDEAGAGSPPLPNGSSRSKEEGRPLDSQEASER